MNNTGSYTVAYVYGDTSGNTGSVSRVVNVVNAAGNPNIRNATIAPPSTNSLYSNSNQEAGRIALSAAGENIRVQKIVFANSGSSDLSHIINASLVDVGDGSIIPAIYTISGATITFDSMNYSINAFFTKNVKVMLDLSSVVNAYGQTIHLNTNSGAINIIRESDGANLVADDTLLANSSIKTYTLSVVPPTITLTGSTSLIQNEKLATLRIENFDTDTGVTLSGFTLQFTTNFN